jgi:hypoxanthine phosphoribosyltransferase
MMSHNPEKELQLELFIDRQKIEKRIVEIAKKLMEDYEGKELTIVMIMKGAFFLVADLMRYLHLPVRLDFIQCQSYGERGMYKGELAIVGLDALDAREKHLLVVDDIFDTGETISEVIEVLKKQNPASLKSLVLLKKDVPRKTSYSPDYTLFDIEDRFVVGYGLDYKEYYRGLADIYAIHS